MRTFLLLLLAALSASLAVAPDAMAQRRSVKLDQVQAAWSSSVRWSDFEAAWQLVDPEVRAGQPLTELELERYRQLQVSSYREGGNGELDDGTVVRTVEIGVVNRHTQAERTMRFQERWRWDKKSKRWWQMAGLPDFWEGK
ncbi:hypothetical protein [Pseudoxanthomonas koreensis]|uniref:hypothetical protein n=1 Tax=Pseudoxanthomonas koreensis TaxID=266061 RepID=UPI001391B5CB|nr:hypothetical protein [Pseudoxanthomonas koreensis]KAF1693568.1 hypothetical protein CSC64_05385 [Pseudoxanthomonas koreensis]